MQDVLIGLAILAAFLIAAYVITHHKAPETLSGKDLAATVAESASASWDALKRDLPAIVSADVASLRQALSDMEARAVLAEQKLAAEIQASGARLEAVKQQVGSLIAGIGSMPASSALEASQTADVNKVLAFAAKITPAE